MVIVMYFLQLVYRTDPTAKRLVESYDWFVAPVINPDGYAFTFAKTKVNR